MNKRPLPLSLVLETDTKMTATHSEANAESAPAATRGLAPLIARHPTVAALFCLAGAVVYYRILIFGDWRGFLPPVLHGLTFNSMLLHLLNGRFDVAPQVIGREGFVHNGATYAYFGIFPALLRAVFLPMQNFSTTDFTSLSCLAAVSLMALFKLLSLLRVWYAVDIRRGRELVVFFGIAILFSGPQIEFLAPSIFQEVCLWADVFAAAFVYGVICGYCSPRGFTGRLLSLMALAAGLCLLTRVSTALGLFLAFGFLWIHLAWGRARQRCGQTGWLRAALPLLAPVAVLAVFIAAAGLVNYERWGNPLTFVDLRQQLTMLAEFPHRLDRLRDYGEFNPVRLGYGLVYYFFPVWVLPGANGHLLWGAFQQRTINSVELPPSSLLLSAPLLISLSVYMFVHLIRHRDIPRPGVVVAVLSGLAVPPILILCFSFMAFRYSIEFYPFLELSAFIGCFHLLSVPKAPRGAGFRFASILGIAGSELMYVLYRNSVFGPAASYLAHTNILSFYLTLLHL